MTSKELLKRIDERNYLTEREHRQFLEELSKILEEKELLESELKLEKDKVKYVMKQLKKQDEILEILKKTLNNSFLCLVKNKEEQEKVKEWLENGK